MACNLDTRQKTLNFEPTCSVNFCEMKAQNTIFTILKHYTLHEACTSLRSYAAYAGRYQWFGKDRLTETSVCR